MYRQYESTSNLEGRLAELKIEIQNPELDDEERFYIHEDIRDLEDRLNFAYQDEEYDEIG